MFCANENTTWNNHWVLYRVFPFHWRLGAKKSAQRSALIFDIFALNNWSCTFKYSDNTYCSSNFMVTRSSGVHGGQDLFVTHGNNYYFHCDRPIALQLLKAYFNGAISVGSYFRNRFKSGFQQQKYYHKELYPWWVMDSCWNNCRYFYFNLTCRICLKS